LSFSLVTRYHENKAEEYAQGECREKEINFGLDLEGGMNVTIEVSVKDILYELSGKNQSPAYVNAIAAAEASSEDDYLTAFFNSLEQSNVNYAYIFSSMALKDKVKLDSSNEDVEKVVRAEVESAIDKSFNVLRTRIDRFGVVQPNFQELSQTGRILIELPGIKEPERVRKLLQASANLEFWETYELAEIFSMLAQINEETTVYEEKDSADVVEEVNVASSLFAKLQPSLYQTGQTFFGPVVGTVHYTDTAKVMAILNSNVAKSILPRDLKFAWTVKAIDAAESQYQLIALRPSGTDLSPALAGDVITDAHADFGPRSTYANVSMKMNSEGAHRWRRITRENICRSIAIVLDGYVYSFRTVQNEITSGRSQITGNFTVDEAKDLANILNSGKMPASARIVDEVVGPSR
jgi:SecD/SecF fusion protein